MSAPGAAPEPSMLAAEWLDALDLLDSLPDQSPERQAALVSLAEREAERAAAIFDASLKAGELRELNKTFKRQRLAAKAAGKRFPKYPAWIDDQRARIVRAAAVAEADRKGWFKPAL